MYGDIISEKKPSKNTTYIIGKYIDICNRYIEIDEVDSFQKAMDKVKELKEINKNAVYGILHKQVEEFIVQAWRDK